MRIVLLLFLITTVRVHGQVSDFMHTDFTKADSIAMLYPEYSITNTKDLADKLTATLCTDEEKFRAIYRWVCENISFDYELLAYQQQKKQKLKKEVNVKKPDKEFNERVFSNLLKYHKTICTGYAYLIKELAQQAQLPCVMINGYGRIGHANIGKAQVDANHSWNAVQLNNKWYLCDATWSSGFYDKVNASFIKKFDDVYFLQDPLIFIQKHFPLQAEWMLLEHEPTLNEFLNGPILYRAANSYEITQLSPKTFDINTIKGKQLSFKFKKNSDLIIETAGLQIKNNNTTSTVKVNISPDETGLYCLNHIFHNKGSHLVHILLNDQFAFTYMVNVK